MNELIEEHEQWVAWSKTLEKYGNITRERLDRWKRLWVPYSELSEKDKEQDRVWARKVLKILQEKYKEVYDGNL